MLSSQLVNEWWVRPAATAAKSRRGGRAREAGAGSGLVSTSSIQPSRRWPLRLVTMRAKSPTCSARQSSSGQRAWMFLRGTWSSWSRRSGRVMIHRVVTHCWGASPGVGAPVAESVKVTADGLVGAGVPVRRSPRSAAPRRLRLVPPPVRMSFLTLLTIMIVRGSPVVDLRFCRFWWADVRTESGLLGRRVGPCLRTCGRWGRGRGDGGADRALLPAWVAGHRAHWFGSRRRAD
jgi:hypothetical protein